MSSGDKFVDYYEAESLSEETAARFAGIKAATQRAAEVFSLGGGPWKVGDIGCGAGTQCMLWARDGHEVYGVDINPKLIEIARERTQQQALVVEYNVSSATELPWEDASKDVILCPELLEHVSDWEACIEEIVRVVRPGGVVFLSTTNWLCPRQQEFTLPLYSWYPGILKRHYERLACTTRPELANYAKFPAVNWFSYFQLRRYFRSQGFRSIDRFEVADSENSGFIKRSVFGILKKATPLRYFAQVASEGTIIFAQKDNYKDSDRRST